MRPRATTTRTWVRARSSWSSTSGRDSASEDSRRRLHGGARAAGNGGRPPARPRDDGARSTTFAKRRECATVGAMPPTRDRSAGRGRAPALVVHGGAGADPADAPDELREGIRAAVAAGWRVLAAGGRSLDAVEAAVRVLEDA